MIGSRSITLKVSVNWIVAILLLAAGLIVTEFLRPPLWEQHFRFVALVLAGAAALLTAVNAIDVRVDQLRQARAMTALDFAHRWGTFAATTLGRERDLPKQLVDLKTPEEKLKYIDASPERRNDIIDIFNFLETLSVAVQEGIVDVRMCRQWFDRVVIVYWEAAEPFIQRRREQYGNPFMFCEVEALYKDWSEKRRKHGPVVGPAGAALRE